MATSKPQSRGLILFASAWSLLSVLPAAAGAQTFTFKDLTYPNAITTAAYGVNDSGTIVGYYCNDIGTCKVPTGGFYGPPANLNPLSVPGCSSAAAQGINNNGAIVGAVTSCSGVAGESFLTTDNGGTFKLFTPPSGTGGVNTVDQSGASGINGSGRVVGFFVQKIPPIGEGYLTSDEAAFTPLMDPTQPHTTLGAGINDAETVVGFYVVGTQTNVGFLYSGGAFYDVKFPGATSTNAQAIDTKGDIVGYYQDSGGVYHGFIWTGYALSGGAVTGGTPTPLDDPNAGSNFQQGTKVIGISPNGQEIVGYYLDSSNNTIGFYATTQATGSLTLSSSPNPSFVTQQVMFTATVTPSNATGTVTFTDLTTSTQLGMASVNSGTAVLNYSSLAIGSHNIQATYSGSAGSLTSNTVTQTVNVNPTSTSLGASPNPSNVGQQVTFTATVTTTGVGTPTGSVTFNDNGTSIGTAALSNGTAKLQTSSLSVGTHPIQAVYSGDSSFSSSSSTPVSQVVNKNTTSTALSSAPNPSVLGQNVTFTATVSVTSQGAGTPTGTVTFTIDGTAQSPVALSGGGQAQLSVSNLSIASHTVTAVYNGDANFAASPVSNPVTQVVNTAGSMVLSSSVNPSLVNQPVTFTVTLPSGTTGTITWYINNVQQGSPVTISNNQAQLINTFAQKGPYTVDAHYTGSDGITPADVTLTQTVNPLPTGAVTLTSSANPSQVNKQVTFTATVPGGATGTITFTVDNGSGTIVNISNSQAPFPYTFTTTGNHTVTAAYSGDGNFTPGSASLTQVVNTLPPGTVTLSSSANPSQLGKPVTFTARVPTGATGTITFNIDNAPGTAVTVNNSQAIFPYTFTTTGNHTVAAVYSGDANFAPASASLTQIVNLLQTTTVTLSSSPNPATYGGGVTFTATVTVGATGTITFTIDGKSQAQIVINGGQARYTTSALSAGSHTVSATYSGDNNFQGGTSNSVTQTITQVASGLGLSSSPNPSASGQAVAVTAVVAPTATGTVTFTIDGKVDPPVTMSAGQASISLTNLSIGNHAISASYSGDSNFAPSTATLTQNVTPLPPSFVTLASSMNPSIVGQPVTFTLGATNNLPINADGLPISFLDGSTPLGTAIVSGGQASITTSSLLAGAHEIIANVLGTAVSANIGQVVYGMPSAITATVTPGAPIAGQPLTVSIQVGASGTAPKGTPAPSGQVMFQDNGYPVGNTTLTGGAGSLSLNGLPAGDHQITAVYAGDRVWGSSFSRVSFTVVQPTVQASNSAAPLSSGFAPDEQVSLFRVTGLNGDITNTMPLGTSLAGVSVNVTDSAGTTRPALIYGAYASAGQINLVIPGGTANGTATLTVTTPGGITSIASIKIANTAAAVYSANMTGQGVFAGQVVYAHADGTQTVDSAATFDPTQKAFMPNPINLGTATDQVYLVMYGTGIRHYTGSVTATVNGVTVPILTAAQSTNPGLDQMNLQLPQSLAGAGNVNIVITVDGQAANTVTATIQ